MGCDGGEDEGLGAHQERNASPPTASYSGPIWLACAHSAATLRSRTSSARCKCSAARPRLRAGQAGPEHREAVVEGSETVGERRGHRGVQQPDGPARTRRARRRPSQTPRGRVPAHAGQRGTRHHPEAARRNHQLPLRALRTDSLEGRRCDSWPAIACHTDSGGFIRELPRWATLRTTLISPSTRTQPSYEDTFRGMSRGSNHGAQEATRDTGREQKAQIGRRKASAITRSTGLRRRERRFESCRGHHVYLGRSASYVLTTIEHVS